MSQKLNRFHLYMDKYESLVAKNARQYVDEHLVEDVAQETFAKMYEHLDHLDDDRIANWLAVVSGNIAKDYLKKGGGNITDYVEMQELELLMEERYDSAEQCFETKEKQKAVCALIQTAWDLLYEKNLKWYYVMVDSCTLGMSSAEIGKVMGMSTSHLDATKSRARAYLRRKLGKDFRDLF